MRVTVCEHALAHKTPRRSAPARKLQALRLEEALGVDRGLLLFFGAEVFHQWVPPLSEAG